MNIDPRIADNPEDFAKHWNKRFEEYNPDKHPPLVDYMAEAIKDFIDDEVLRGLYLEAEAKQ